MQGMINQESMATSFDKLTQELRRGVLVLATLSQLKEARYGYALIDQLRRRGLDIDQGTLYPLLRRLEDQGLLQSEWRVEDSRPRRYYVISTTGKDLLKALANEWHELAGVISDLLREEEEG